MIGHNEIEYASRTDVGIRRSHNQDAHASMPASDDERWRQVGHVFLVCDGMGGHAVGELAAKIAVDNIPHIFSKYAHHGAANALRRAFADANSIIHTRGTQNAEFKGMGTTGIALVLRPEGAWVGHVGDSRAYRIRGGIIEQLSFDHSYLWELARRQRKDPEELTGIQSNLINRSLGSLPSVEVDIEGPHPLEKGDIFLLCSDGLSGQVKDREIGAVVTALPPEEAVQFLVHLANLQGGPDNTTVIVVRVGGEPRLAGGDSQAEVVFSSSEAPANPPLNRMAQFLGRAPWAFVFMLLGICFAGVSMGVAAISQLVAAISVFILAVLSLMAGIVTLMVQNYRETHRLSSAPEDRPLQVYRKSHCALDHAIYEKLVQSAMALEETITEKQWEYDKKSYQDRLKQANQHSTHKRLREAFREQCRAMLVLMEAVHSYRGKNEDFKPLW